MSDEEGEEEASTNGGEEVSQTEVATDVGSGDESIVDLAQEPVVMDRLKLFTGTFALAAVGFGLYTILWADVIEEVIWDGPGADIGGFMFMVDMFPYLAIFVAPVIGLYLGKSMVSEDRTAFLASGLSTGVGTLVGFILTAVLVSIVDGAPDLDFGNLIVLAIVAGIVAALVAVGGAWLSRNQAPDDW